MGIIPESDMRNIVSSSDQINSLIYTLSAHVRENTINTSTQFFIFFAISSSLIGVSISLYHLFLDYFNKYHPTLALAATILPPTLFVIISATVFTSALKFAGICILILFAILTQEPPAN